MGDRGIYLMDKPSIKLGQNCAEVDRDGSIKQFLERASAHSGAVWNQTKPIALNLDFFQTWVTGCGYGGRSEQRGHWQGALKAEGEDCVANMQMHVPLKLSQTLNFKAATILSQSWALNV